METLQSSLDDIEGVVGPALIKHTHAVFPQPEYTQTYVFLYAHEVHMSTVFSHSTDAGVCCAS